MAEQVVTSAEPATPVTREQRGRIVGGRYLLGDRIGTGGAAMVYRALDLRLNRPVAVKVMHPFFTGSAGLLEEARRAAAIASPHIVGMLDAGEDPEPFLVMELAPGGGLDRVLGAGQLTPGQAVTVGVAIGRALDAAHARGLVHGDVKPSNILCTPAGPKLGDFGSALVRRAGAATLPPSAIAATVMYAAPEQFSGKPAPASDQYALALTLVTCLAGRLPWDSPEEAIGAKRDGDVDPGEACGPLRPVLAQAHDGPFAEALFDLADRQLERLLPRSPRLPVARSAQTRVPGSVACPCH